MKRDYFENKISIIIFKGISSNIIDSILGCIANISIYRGFIRDFSSNNGNDRGWEWKKTSHYQYLYYYYNIYL